MKQYYTYLPSILFLIFNLGCGDSPGDNHSSNDNYKIAGDVSLDIATLLTDGSPKLDLNSLLSEELDPENNKSQPHLADFYNGTNNVPNIAVPEEALKMSNQESNISYKTSLTDNQNLDAVAKDFREYDDLQNEDVAKDATIASLKELNNGLLEEIRRLREYSTSQTVKETTTPGNPLASSEVNQLGTYKDNYRFKRYKLTNFSLKTKT